MTRRLHLPGLFAVLLALMAQLGVGATVPRIDPLLAIGAAEVLCHPDQAPAGHDSPGHPSDCPLCPLCAALHAPPAILASGLVLLPPPTVLAVRPVRSLPPATAPPRPYRTARQPRAPPSEA